MNERELGLAAGRALRYAGDDGALAFVALAQADMLDDAAILERAGYFLPWDENWTGKSGTIVSEAGLLYRSIHDVGAGQNTRPSATPSMWTRIGDPGDEYPEWFQPIGAHDAYALGDKVTHNGKRWVSAVDGNVWEPGVYGWEEATE